MFLVALASYPKRGNLERKTFLWLMTMESESLRARHGLVLGVCAGLHDACGTVEDSTH